MYIHAHTHTLETDSPVNYELCIQGGISWSGHSNRGFLRWRELALWGVEAHCIMSRWVWEKENVWPLGLSGSYFSGELCAFDCPVIKLKCSSLHCLRRCALWGLKLRGNKLWGNKSSLGQFLRRHFDISHRCKSRSVNNSTVSLTPSHLHITLQLEPNVAKINVVKLF